MHRVSLFFLAFFFFLQAGFGQAPPDAVPDSLRVYLEKAEQLTFSNPEQALPAARSALALAQKHGLKNQAGKAYQRLSRIHAERGDYTKALEAINAGIKIFEALNGPQEVCTMYISLGIVNRHLKLYDASIEAYLRAEAVARQHDFARIKAAVYGNLGNLYFDRQDYDQALLYHRKSLTIDVSLGNEQGIGNTYHNIGMIYRTRQEYATALKYYEKSLAIDRKKNNQQNVAISYNDFARIYLEMGNHREALHYSRQALAVARTIGAVRLRQEMDEAIQYFATSLYGKNTVDEILWDVAKNCIARLGFVDCVIYLLDPEQNALVQKAAYGTKNPEDYAILNPLVIPVGKGIVGNVALTGRAEIIPDTSADPRYLVDDQMRYSELAVPLVLHDRVIGVIDSEHPEKGFFQAYHLEALQTIAAICSSKIARTQADEEARKARLIRLEAEHIKKLDRVKSQFFANLSHEFRTPLHLILAPLQKREAGLSGQEMRMMKRNARRLLRLVNQLLDLAKAEMGMLTLQPSPGNVFGCLRQVAYSFRALAENRGIRYHNGLPEEALSAFFDADKLEKIVYNLLSNAFKFTPPGGQVTIETEIEVDATLRIIVTDTGPGIPDHLQDKIFDRFYQVDSSATRSFEGTGIGLALTKELVEVCRGTIAVHSRPGQGSTFTVRLPLRYDSADPGKRPEGETPAALIPADAEADWTTPDFPADAAEAAEGKPVLLLVEDNAELSQYLRQQLTGRFRVVLASQGEEGVGLAKKLVPDLIITDIQ